MSNIAQIDLTTLQQEQLMLLQSILPDQVREELDRRSAYQNLEDGLTDLAFCGTALEMLFENERHTKVVRLLKKIGLHSVIRRTLITAKLKGYTYETPSLDRIREALTEDEAAGAGSKVEVQ